MQYRRPVGAGAIFEDVPEVGIREPRADFGAAHEEPVVGPGGDGLRLERSGEAGPARSRIELVERAEERFPETTST